MQEKRRLLPNTYYRSYDGNVYLAICVVKRLWKGQCFAVIQAANDSRIKYVLPLREFLDEIPMGVYSDVNDQYLFEEVILGKGITDDRRIRNKEKRRPRTRSSKANTAYKRAKKRMAQGGPGRTRRHTRERSDFPD
jgi:hypothetical protein